MACLVLEISIKLGGDLNLYADLDDLYYINIVVNRGFNGFDLRIKYIQQLIKILDAKSCKNINLTKELGIYLYSTSKIRSTWYGARNQKPFERYDKFSKTK